MNDDIGLSELTEVPQSVYSTVSHTTRYITIKNASGTRQAKKIKSILDQFSFSTNVLIPKIHVVPISNYKTVRNAPFQLSKLSMMANVMLAKNARR